MVGDPGTTGGIRRWATLVGATLVFLSMAIGPSRSSCAPPTIAFEGLGDGTRKEVSPGETVVLVGEHWTPDCFDTGPIGACERGPGDEEPMHGIDVDLLQNEIPIERVVEDVTAEPDLTLRVSFTVPDLEEGARFRVLIHDRGAEGYPELFLLVRR